MIFVRCIRTRCCGARVFKGVDYSWWCVGCGTHVAGDYVQR